MSPGRGSANGQSSAPLFSVINQETELIQYKMFASLRMCAITVRWQKERILTLCYIINFIISKTTSKLLGRGRTSILSEGDAFN